MLANDLLWLVLKLFFFLIVRVKTICLSNGLKKHGTKFLSGEEIKQLRAWGSVAGSNCDQYYIFDFYSKYSLHYTCVRVEPLNCRRETK